MTSIEGLRPFFVSSEVAGQVFDWMAAIRCVQQAYAVPDAPSATPPRSIASSGAAWLRCLPAAPSGSRYFGAKLMGMATDAPEPGVNYVIVLYDRQTSRLVAFVDGEKVTAYRTAATSAAALDKLAPDRPGRLAVLGSGLEATMHTRAFAAIRPFDEIALFSPTQAKREALAAQLSQELGVRCIPVASAQEAVAGAGVVLAAARARGEQPILFGDWLSERVITVSIGSTVPTQREIDVSVVSRCDLIVCDMVHEVMDETGDMIAARAAGIDFADKCHSIADLVSGALNDRVGAARNPMFKSVGGGLQDVVVAGMLLDRARAAGLATQLPITFSTKLV